MRRGRTTLWLLAAASFALAAWLFLPFPERAASEPGAPAHTVTEEPLASVSAAG